METLVTTNITFINEALIPETVLKAVAEVVNTIDSSDVLFVALAKYLNATLWTGDKKLMEGLRPKQFIEVITTTELITLLDKPDQK